MKKYISILIVILGLSTAYAIVAPPSSPAIGTGPVSGYVLQTNGTTSTWVATSTLGILGDFINGIAQNFNGFKNFLDGIQTTTLTATDNSLLASTTVQGYLNALSRTEIGSSQSPTHSLTLDASSTGIAIYNTKDQVTNYERTTVGYSGTNFRINSENAGTGINRALLFQTNSGAATSNYIQNRGNIPFHQFNVTSTGVSNAGIGFVDVVGNFGGGTSTTQIGLSIRPNVTQSINASYIGLLINSTETALGTGTKMLIQAGTSTNPSMFTVNNLGNVGIGTSLSSSSLQISRDIAGLTDWMQGSFGGKTTEARGVTIGYDTTNNIGHIYSRFAGVGVSPLSLNNGKIYINANGLVGISTTTPNSSLWVTGTGVTSMFTIASSSNVSIFNIDSRSHIVTASSTATTPVLSTCGTSPIIVGNDTAGTVTEGTVASGCTITFTVPYVVAPHCVVSYQSGLSASYTTTASALTITNIGALSSTNIDYHCFQ